MTNYDEYSSVFPLRSNLCTHFILEVKSRLEEAKVNSQGRATKERHPGWVYAPNGTPCMGKSYIQQIISWIPVLFAFAHLGRVFKIVKISETVLRYS